MEARPTRALLDMRCQLVPKSLLLFLLGNQLGDL